MAGAGWGALLMLSHPSILPFFPLQNKAGTFLISYPLWKTDEGLGPPNLYPCKGVAHMIKQEIGGPAFSLGLTPIQSLRHRPVRYRNSPTCDPPKVWYDMLGGGV